ncbi:MAG: type II secretion system protein [Patescibacteria group bacterium]
MFTKKIQDSRSKIQEGRRSLRSLSPFNFQLPNSSGFTLVEMIVSLGIFAVVATVSLGALVHIVSANKKAQTLQSAITNLNFALETMSREMRVGSTYFCSDYGVGDIVDENNFQSVACALGNNKILAFRSSKVLPNGPGATCKAIIAYKFWDPVTDKFAILKAEQSTCDQDLDIAYSPLLATDDIDITDITLSVSEQAYPLAFIRVSGSAGVREREKSYFDVQTAISPRLFED